jgi:mRNA interferase RelE/StbE
VTYEVRLSSAAIRSLDALPPKVASAVVEFLFGPLADDPKRIGKLLTGKFGGLHSARRGDYRVLYEIDQSSKRIVVVRVAHRAHAYH